MADSNARIYRDGQPVSDLMVSAYEVRPQHETIRSDGWWVPDPHWSQQHGGHDHAWEQREGVAVVTNAYPDQQPCDGACGDPEHTETVWKCNVFHGRLRPGTTFSGPITREMLQHTDVTIRVSTSRPDGLPVRLDGCEIRWDIDHGYGHYSLPAEMPRGEVTISNGHPTEAEYTGRIYPR